MLPETCNHGDTSLFNSMMVCSSCGVVRSLIDKAPTVSPCGQVIHPPEVSTFYQYSGLSRDRDEIRLVVLLPGDEKDPVNCRIITTELDSAPSFIAVSYTWATEDGDCSKSHEIHVKMEGTNGQVTKRIQATANCVNTLRQLRGQGFEQILWIDAVCIDQLNTYERNHQVRLMERIYETATHVEICIQDTCESYLEALALFQLNYGLHFVLDNEIMDTADPTMYVDLDRDQVQITRLARAHENTGQIKALFERNYFGRVWVIQEILFAKFVILRINQATVKFDQERLDRIHRWCNQRHIRIPRLHHWRSIWNRDGGIISCLYMSLECDASDPRDKVFAITSLLRPIIRDVITIGYQSDLQAVYMDAIAACILECGDLDILGFARLPPNTNIFTTSTFSESDFKRFLAQRTLSKAPVPTMTQMRHPWTPHIALKHNTVKKEIHAGYAKPDNASAVEILYNPIPSTQVLPRLGVQAHLVDITTSTTHTSTQQMLKDLAQDIEEIVTSPWHWLLEFFKSPPSNLQHGPYTSPALQTLRRDLEHAKQPFSNDDEQVLFRTHYSLGFSGSAVLPGDEIFAIDGVRHLFVLRRVGSGSDVYRIVGTAYLWGGMNLDYWNPGSFLGIWADRPFYLGSERTRRVEIY